MDLSRVREALESGSTPIVRTDFTDDTAWQTVVKAVSLPVDFDNHGNTDPDGVFRGFADDS